MLDILKVQQWFKELSRTGNEPKVPVNGGI